VGSDAEMEFFASNASVIQEKTGAVVLTNPPDVVAIGRDKWKTVEFLKAHGLNYPVSMIPDPDARGEDAIQFVKHKVGFPVVVKPRRGSGAKDFFVVEDEESLLFQLRRISEPIVQEHLPETYGEFTTGTFVCKDGTVAGTITMRRLLKKGDTVEAEVGEFPPVVEEVGRILKVLPVNGVCNFQMRLTGRGAVAFEINPRFSGSAAMRAYFGFNEVEASLRHFLLGEIPRNLKPRTGVAVRFYQELYLSAGDVEELTARGFIRGPRAHIEERF
jgi:carbamoyl-phosphate synthase large subunit